MYETIEQYVTQIPALYLFCAFAGMIIAETSFTVGMILAGTTSCLLMGFVAQIHGIPVYYPILLSIAAEWFGTQVGFYKGKQAESFAAPGKLLSRWLKPELLEKSREKFTASVPLAIFSGQFISGARTLIPRIAGSAISYTRFMTFNIPAVMLWAGGFTLLGYLAGNQWSLVTEYFGSASQVIFLILLLAFGMAALARAVTKFPFVETKFSRWLNSVSPFNAIENSSLNLVKKIAHPSVRIIVNTLLLITGLLVLIQLLKLITGFIVTTSLGNTIDININTWFADHHSFELAIFFSKVLWWFDGPFLWFSLLFSSLFPLYEALKLRRVTSWDIMTSTGILVPCLVMLISDRILGDNFDWTSLTGMKLIDIDYYGPVLVLPCAFLFFSWRAAVKISRRFAFILGMINATIIIISGVMRCYIPQMRFSEFVAGTFCGIIWATFVISGNRSTDKHHEAQETSIRVL